MIVRAPRPTAGFLIVQNAVVRDRRLSYRARGVLLTILSFPDYWSTSSEALAAMAPDTRGNGKAALNAAKRELIDAGYMIVERNQNALGQWSTITTVYDVPQLSTDDPTDCPQPKADYPTPALAPVKKEPELNNPVREQALNVSNRKPRVCGSCSGTGWTPAGEHDLERCTCDAGIRR